MSEKAICSICGHTGGLCECQSCGRLVCESHRIVQGGFFSKKYTCSKCAEAKFQSQQMMEEYAAERKQCTRCGRDIAHKEGWTINTSTNGNNWGSWEGIFCSDDCARTYQNVRGLNWAVVEKSDW